MTNLRSRLLILSLFISVCAPCAPTASADALQERLNLDFDGKVLTQRQFIPGSKIEYDAEGNAASGTMTGPWTTDGQFE